MPSSTFKNLSDNNPRDQMLSLAYRPKNHGIDMAIMKAWPDPSSAARFKLHLLIHEMEHLLIHKSDWGYHSRSLIVQIEWRGHPRRGGLLGKSLWRNCTSVQKIQENGVVCWNEVFDHTCKLKRISSQHYREWFIGLEIQEFIENYKGKLPTIASASVDVAKFAQLGNDREIRVPIKFNVIGCAAEAMLMVKLHFTDLQTKSIKKLPQDISFRSMSCAGFPHTYSTGPPSPISAQKDDNTEDGRVSHSRSAVQYSLSGKIALTKIPLNGKFSSKLKDEEDLYPQLPSESSYQAKQPSLLRIFSWNRKKLSTKSMNHSKCLSFLTQTYSETSLDDSNNDQHPTSSIQSAPPPPQETESRPSVGHWEKKRVMSRDGEMVLVTDIFLASIDQRSEKAAGGSACTVLAAVIAYWLHNNPKILPQKSQFDELIQQGSSEWRKLCGSKNHKEQFIDQHFDLDTVLQAKLRPLSVVTEKSYIGFFSLSEITGSLEFLEGVMSFDSIWNELTSSDPSDERIYITSWNDHFFVIKVETDAIYLIDTLGERLHEGCNQAYILRFDRKSKVYRQRRQKGRSQGGIGDEQEHSSSQEVICEGMVSCREYIKGFLAALPLRDLAQDIKKGLIQKVPLDRRLQIEFHYMVPYAMRSLSY